MTKIAIFASGSGTNTETIANYFSNSKEIEISAILCNNSTAFVIKRAKKLNIPTLIFTKNEFQDSKKVLNFLIDKKIDLIVLAGFLWLIPDNLIEQYPNKIINIHPALLPKYGGKGMYGERVHKTVVENNETETGITIHFVNEKYDEGQIIFQAKCSVNSTDTPETVATKVHELEYQFFPKIIEQVAISLK